MKPSTANFISYDVRPAKQAERRIILDFLKCANEANLTISDCRYVGTGGTMFYDFHLMHRFLGINDMISLERDSDTHPRAQFNCPFDFIEVRNESVADFLARDRDETTTIYWFDYDDGISADIIADITTLGTRLKVGGFAFVTVCGQPPRVLEKETTEARLEYFEQQFRDFALSLSLSDMENASFPMTVYRVLLAAFKNAFASRGDGQFEPLLRIQYRDTMPMVSVGGAFCEKDTAEKLVQRVEADLPFLLKTPPYKIRNLYLTERERVLFDMAVTKRRSNSRQSNALRKLGFRARHFAAYRDLIRFLPRYYESII